MTIASFITGNLKQDAVYWAVGAGVDDGDGNIVYATPVEITVRWQDVNELQSGSSQENFLSVAIIYSQTELEDNAWLYLGLIADIVGVTTDPRNVAGAYRIKKKAKSTRLKNATEHIYKVWI